MSGHSKWSTIKRKKGALDAKRGQIFTRVVKEIQLAVKEGGPDFESNPKLRIAIQNAKSANMPKDNIERAISKASNEGANIVEVTFEGYGNYGIAIFIECLTDNNLRTVSAVRSVFNKRGGTMGTNGSLSFLFERKGVFTINKTGLIREDLELELIDAGLDELDEDDVNFIIYTKLEDFGSMQKKLDEMKINIENAVLQRIPNDTKVIDVSSAKKILQHIEEFEDLDDVQNVYHNLEMTPELEKALNE
ncbi:MAG: transcriptional regulator [Bacteroidetes bacterium GWF2_38_335]|nr:MAG: transcriptional regulator [Bacteroidetes bacterium GWF2_38_335]OFY78575.1 MAG: transcriptional regulator [Bacteroidetes bacterium RIFOXYA12_FULL_38_20]HBS85071.1 YebC/PmpR family DNA-binding transcriptional regulator [Bacteroidales bacterium]